MALRFQLQRNVCVAPKSSKKHRMEENFKVSKFCFNIDNLLLYLVKLIALHLSYLCNAGAVLTSLSLTQKVTGLNNLSYKKIIITEFNEFSENHVGKTPLESSQNINCVNFVISWKTRIREVSWTIICFLTTLLTCLSRQALDFELTEGDMETLEKCNRDFRLNAE